METCALGTAAPEASFTVPVSVAPATCAYVWPVPKTVIATITNIQTTDEKFRTNSLGSIEIFLNHRRTGTFRNLTDLLIGTRDLFRKRVQTRPVCPGM